METLLRTVLLLLCALFSSVTEGRDCSRPPEFPGFRMVRGSKDSAMYKCAEGYSPYGGRPVIKCNRGRWDQLTLQCRKKSCGNAGELLNGYFEYEGEAVLGDKAFVICYEGYKVKGPKVIECGSQGWPTELPTCEEGVATCSAPEVANSWTKGLAREYSVGDSVMIRCIEGFQMEGQGMMTCGSNGYWQLPLPQCVPTPTRPKPEITVTCSAPKVANSATKDFAHEYNVGDSVMVRCNKGFQIKGPTQMTCGSDGQWQPPFPQCVRGSVLGPALAATALGAAPVTELGVTPAPVPAKNDRCGVPENIEGTKAMLAPKFYSQKSFASGTRVYYMCDMGHVIARGSKYRVCMKGRWSPLELRCKRKRCGSVGELLNGRYNYTGTEFGDSATAVCDPGFQLVGRAKRHCLSRGWDGHPPVCEAMTCDDPAQVENADIIGFTDGPFEYRTVVTYRCRVGSATGPTDIWCTEDGTWTAPQFECKDATCPPPEIPNSLWRKSSTGQYRYRHSIDIYCNPPYRRNGPRTISCDKNGQWSPILPTCR